jgi:hypothetical protein
MRKYPSSFENYNIESEILLRFIAWFLNRISLTIAKQFGYKKYEELCNKVLEYLEFEGLLKQILNQKNSNKTFLGPFAKLKTLKLAEAATKVLKNKEEI